MFRRHVGIWWINRQPGGMCPGAFRMAAIAFLMVLGGVLTSVPQASAEAVAQPTQAQPAGAESRPVLEALYARLGKVMAELQAARSAPVPDLQRISSLVNEAQKLRAEIWSQHAGTMGAGAAMGRGPWCPWGLGAGRGPGLGFRQGPQRGQGAVGFPGYRRGAGPRGPGWGFVDRNGNGICDFFEGLPR
jgi:hypothetical protein